MTKSYSKPLHILENLQISNCPFHQGRAPQLMPRFVGIGRLDKTLNFGPSPDWHISNQPWFCFEREVRNDGIKKRVLLLFCCMLFHVIPMFDCFVFFHLSSDPKTVEWGDIHTSHLLFNLKKGRLFHAASFLGQVGWTRGNSKLFETHILWTYCHYGHIMIYRYCLGCCPHPRMAAESEGGVEIPYKIDDDFWEEVLKLDRCGSIPSYSSSQILALFVYIFHPWPWFRSTTPSLVFDHGPSRKVMV